MAIVCDLLEEDWPSMDLISNMLLKEIRRADPTRAEATRVCPAMKKRFTLLPPVSQRLRRVAFNADRLANRMWDYPHHLKSARNRFDFFHVCDHSYANVVHGLPRGKTGVFCHDLDTFRCLLEPKLEPRPLWFRAMAQHILAGLKKADLVFYSTNAVRAQIDRHAVVDERRLVHAAYGICEDFTCEVERPDPSSLLLEPLGAASFLLHVGSCIPRKRVDVLLNVFARVHESRPELRLVQVGGEWTPEQRRLLEKLRIGGAVLQLPRQDSRVIAALYRNASLVLMPSEAEGFGLPVVEAVACGAGVLASDITVLREVGGNVVTFAPVGDVGAWAASALRLLAKPEGAAPLTARSEHAARFSWAKHAKTVVEAYRGLI